MAEPPAVSKPTITVRQRLSSYQRDMEYTRWLGAGLLAVVTVFAAVKFSNPEDVPPVLAALVPTFVVVAGICMAYALFGFRWRAFILQRELDAKRIKPGDNLNDIPDETIPRKDRDWPKRAVFFYYSALVLTCFAGLSLLLFLWWPVIPWQAIISMCTRGVEGS